MLIVARKRRICKSDSDRFSMGKPQFGPNRNSTYLWVSQSWPKTGQSGPWFLQEFCLPNLGTQNLLLKSGSEWTVAYPLSIYNAYERLNGIWRAILGGIFLCEITLTPFLGPATFVEHLATLNSNVLQFINS